MGFPQPSHAGVGSVALCFFAGGQGTSTGDAGGVGGGVTEGDLGRIRASDSGVRVQLTLLRQGEGTRLVRLRRAQICGNPRGV